jgi:phosphoribosylaminoimidazole-succinocarboxamide synthase
VGDHDENIDFDAVDLVGRERAEQVRDATLAHVCLRPRLRGNARDHPGRHQVRVRHRCRRPLYVMDEMLTPDSSRYWPADDYQVGTSPPSYDKQFVRDYLETLDWDKTPPGPRLAAEVIARTRAKYAEALDRLAGISVD